MRGNTLWEGVLGLNGAVVERDRDRGRDFSRAPPAPPYVRVRIRRFKKLMGHTASLGSWSAENSLGGIAA